MLPASVTPHGVSLAEMAAEVAPFTASGNDPTRYPATPFQILHVLHVDLELAGSGVVATGTSSFSVAAATHLYLPIFNVTDEPPLLGVFPETAADAAPYFFDRAQYGGDFEVAVDGCRTEPGADYLAGPVAVHGWEARMITLAVFIGTLASGSHTVAVRGGIYGAGVVETYGTTFLREEFTYRVHVRASS